MSFYSLISRNPSSQKAFQRFDFRFSQLTFTSTDGFRLCAWWQFRQVLWTLLLRSLASLLIALLVYILRWHIRFTSLRAKKLRASDINGFSDPFVSFVGPNLIQEFHSKVKHQTLNPVWNPLQELPTLVLSTFPLQRVEKEYLLVRVLDHDSDEDALGYGVIPLGQAVACFKKGVLEVAQFKVNLSHHGLPAGTLEGGMKLTWEKNVIKKGYSGDFNRGTSIKDSLKKKIFVRKPSPK